MKKFQLLKWTAEVSEKELQFLFFNGHNFDDIDLLKDHDSTVIFETESASEAYEYLEKESKLLHIHKFNSCGLKFAEVDCLLLREVEFDEDGNIEEYEYLNICYPEEE